MTLKYFWNKFRSKDNYVDEVIRRERYKLHQKFDKKIEDEVVDRLRRDKELMKIFFKWEVR